MWCPSCRADVAAELSTDNRRMLCARCSTELGIAAAALPQIAATPRNSETERDARDLLARWSAQNLLDVPSPTGTNSPFARGSNSSDGKTPKSNLRFDSPQSVMSAPSGSYLNSARNQQEASSVIPLKSIGHESETSHQGDRIPRKRSRRTQIAETSTTVPEPIGSNATKQQPADSSTPITAIPLDHDAEIHPHPHPRPMSWSTLAGQLCAYAGVGLLTCGTVLVMWSYFGGPSTYMPTGWLAAAIGQMLLFLGVITLISSGMEQTISEVAWRIDHLAEEVHHMGNALDQFESELRKSIIDRPRKRRDHLEDGQSHKAA